MPDTTTQVKAILARTLRELEQVIDNARITSLLRRLGSVLGVEQDGATATNKPTSRPATTAKPKRVTASRASTGPWRTLTRSEEREGAHTHACQLEGRLDGPRELRRASGPHRWSA